MTKPPERVNDGGHRLPQRPAQLGPAALFGNLAAGATVKDFLEWFPGVEEWQVKAVLEHEVKSLDAKVSRRDARIEHDRVGRR